MQAKNNGGHRENHIAFESTTAYLKLLKNQTLEFTGIVLKKECLEVTEAEAEDQTTQCVQQFIQKEMNFLKLFNVPFVTTEERKTENKLENIMNNIAKIQYQLISNKSRDNKELLDKIAELKNDFNTEFNDSFGLKI